MIYASDDDGVSKALLKGQYYSHVRSWYVGDIDTGKVEIRATCRRCGDHGTFTVRQDVDDFKAAHQNEQGICPFAKDVMY